MHADANTVGRGNATARCVQFGAPAELSETRLYRIDRRIHGQQAGYIFSTNQKSHLNTSK
jgi:hypothetical protein